jgi:hypothetical protein
VVLSVLCVALCVELGVSCCMLRVALCCVVLRCVACCVVLRVALCCVLHVFACDLLCKNDSMFSDLQ